MHIVSHVDTQLPLLPMDDEQRVQIVDLINEANDALVELSGRIKWEDNELNARSALDRAIAAVHSALAILEP